MNLTPEQKAHEAAIQSRLADLGAAPTSSAKARVWQDVVGLLNGRSLIVTEQAAKELDQRIRESGW